MDRPGIAALVLSSVAAIATGVALRGLQDFFGRLDTLEAAVEAAGAHKGPRGGSAAAADSPELVAARASADDLAHEIRTLELRLQHSGALPGDGSSADPVSVEQVPQEVARYVAAREQRIRTEEAARVTQKASATQKVTLGTVERSMGLTGQQSEKLLKILAEQNEKVRAVLETEVDNVEYGRRMREIDEETTARTREVLTDEQKQPLRLKMFPKSWYGGLVNRVGSR